MTKTSSLRRLAVTTVSGLLLAATWAIGDTYSIQDGTGGYSGHVMRQIRPPNLGSSAIKSAVGMFLPDEPIRSVNAFDLCIVSGLTVTNVTLTLVVQSIDSGFNNPVQMHEITNANSIVVDVLEDETTNYTTWANVKTATAWGTAGGDYAATVLSSVNPTASGDQNGVYSTSETFTFRSSPALVAAVQNAVDTDQLFQFILCSAEQETSNTQAFVRWHSDTALTTVRPTLTVQTESVELGALSQNMEYQMRIEFNDYSGPPLTNFPALIVFADGSNRFSYAQAKSGGTDLRFADADGLTLIDHEIESWGAGSTNSLVWVRVPVLQNGTTIWAYWGNPALGYPVSQFDGAVWTNAYAGVWHMTARDAPNSAAGGVGATAENNVTVADGRISSALYFGNTNTIDYLTVDGTGPADPDVLTLSAWVKLDAGGAGMVYAHRSEVIRLIQLFAQSTSEVRLQLRGSGNSIQEISATGLDLTQWTHLVGVFDNVVNRHVLYINGVGSTPNTTDFGTQTFTSSQQTIGTYGTPGVSDGIEGLIDEMRVSTSARSADWVSAAYATVVSNATFTSYGNASRSYTRGTLITIH